MRILAIIPARGGSKGVPGKNIKLLGELPLLAYTTQSALASKLLTKVIVSTDCSSIATVAKKYGVEVPFLRPESLATDSASSISVVQHAVSYLENQNEFFDAVCLLQPTYPFRPKGFIDQAIQKFIQDDTDALLSVLPVPHEFNPHWVFEPDEKGFLQIATGENEIIKRRQDLPTAFFRDGAIYITKITVVKKGSLYGDKLSYLESHPDFYINIDTLEDWEKATIKLPLIKSQL
ncbi:MAG: acylneuraminate cytidylyltransferase family protein [Flavobacteriales bacterium]|nr:acylneuraminate cytidylyltransferase family protein [Flavobacteriales bacterium]